MTSRGSNRARARSARLAHPRVIVGADFGTTFSGFAYALNTSSTSDPPRVFYDWPQQKEATSSPYCKTTTSLYYLPQANGQWKLKNWGWPAQIRHAKALDNLESVSTVSRDVASLNVGDTPGVDSHETPSAPQPGASTGGENVEGGSSSAPSAAKSDKKETGELVKLFKLLLCEDKNRSNTTLPEGLELDRVISDYLAQMGQFALNDIKKAFGEHLVMSDLQWVITVPSIWDDRAKQRMKKCMERANLVQPRGRVDSNGGSRHELLLILEPEAGSIYCRSPDNWPKGTDTLSPGNSFVVVDAGGGTVDLVGQVEYEEGRTRELAPSGGNLCGGKFVDEEFVKYLNETIPVLQAFVDERPSTMIKLMQQWFSKAKNSFSGEAHDSSIIDIPTSLAKAWERHIEEHGLESRDTDEIIISSQDLRQIYDPVVVQVLNLIRKQVAAVPGCKAILMVGGFSESKYLQMRVREAFRDIPVVKPRGAGGAVCVGATLYGLRPNLVVSRIARKTYGIRVNKLSLKSNPFFFMAGIGLPFVLDVEENSFLTFVNKGEEVDVDSHITHTVQPSHPGQKEASIKLYSSEDTDVESTTDWGVKKEGKFTFLMPDTTLGLDRELEIQMHFGRSSVEVTARPLNFRQGTHEDGSLSVNFDGEDVTYT